MVVWFAGARRLRRRVNSTGAKIAFGLVVSSIPTVLACSAVHYAITRPWASGFLPDLPITQLPLPLAAVLSVGFCTVLAAVWACARKPETADAVAPVTEAHRS